MAFKPWLGGRLTGTDPQGRAFEVGRVTQWAPGEKLAFTWRQASFAADQWIEVEVRFEPPGAETRVTVEHSGWDRVPAEHVARHGSPRWRSSPVTPSGGAISWRRSRAASAAGERA